MTVWQIRCGGYVQGKWKWPLFLKSRSNPLLKWPLFLKSTVRVLFLEKYPFLLEILDEHAYQGDMGVPPPVSTAVVLLEPMEAQIS